MADDERARLHRLVAQRRPPSPDLGAWFDALCAVTAGELAVDAAVLSAGPDERGDFAVVAASAPQARRCAETEFAIGAGPSRDASALRRPVLVRDLQSRASISWPGLAEVAAAQGVRSVSAFPLQLGALRVGILTAYASGTDALTPAGVRTGLLLAEMAMLRMIDPGAPAPTDPTDDGLGRRLDDSVERRSEVYQAQGMVAVAAGTDLGAALALLRAYAFGSGRDLGEVAGAVVRGELDLSTAPPGPRDGGADHHQDRDTP